MVTLDVSMPGRSGADLLPAIKRHYPDTQVIMLTAHDETALAIRDARRKARSATS